MSTVTEKLLKLGNLIRSLQLQIEEKKKDPYVNNDLNELMDILSIAQTEYRLIKSNYKESIHGPKYYD